MEPSKLEVDEPQRAGEVLATAFREYGRRPVAYVTIGAVEALASRLANPEGVGIDSAPGHAIIAIAFLVCFTATVCVASGHGDSETERDEDGVQPEDEAGLPGRESATSKQ